jgi:putative ABC transport system permease protein
MNILEAFRMAWNALRANKLRSSLTLLGMVIGVFAIIASVTAVKVIDVYFQESLQLFSSTTFTVSKDPVVRTGQWRGRSRPNITYDQVRRLAREVSFPVSPQEFFGVNVMQYQDRETEPNVRIIGTNQHFMGNFSYEIQSGRGLIEPDVQYARPVTVISPDVAEVLFPNETPLGKTVQIEGQRYEVVGVLESKGSFLGSSFDQRMFAPITRLFNIYGQPQRDISLVSVRAPSVRAVPNAMDDVIGRLRVIRDVPPGEENNFEIDTNDSVQSTFEDFTGTLTAGGAGIGLIALLAAGIGIMNIMLVSVTERTREIGIRKSVGAKKRDILRQFLLEAVFMCQLGGLIGIGLGAAFGNIVAIYFDISAAFPWAWALAGVGAMIGIAMVFGGYPAYKAARLDPIESLRYE